MSILPSGPADPEEDAGLVRSHLPFPVVGVGASAGGLAAFERLLQGLPTDTGMAFVVVLHLAPDHPSSVDVILQRSTRMPVRQVSDDVPIEVNHVYVIPPGRSLSMTDGQLRLGTLERTSARHTAIDQFFRSLGEVHRERAVALVLSGAGADGSQGLRRVKERGGVTLVQSPADAEHDSMPLHAIAAGVADFVLPASDMAQKLMELWDNARAIELPAPTADLEVEPSPTQEAQRTAEDALRHVMVRLQESTGHDFSRYKRATVLRRIERRMQVSRQRTLPEYADYLNAHPEEVGPLLQDMLISVTNFFRDRTAFEALERIVMAEFFEDRPPAARLRAWVAGCASGEEAYSVAMLLLEHSSNASAWAGVQVFATDIDERALTIARAGIYAESIATDIPPVRLRQFFDQHPGQFLVSRTLRERVTFSVHNLLRDPPFSKLDLVSCRNLLIYLDRAAQRQLLETFHFSLRPGGLLFLGSAETADAAPEHFTVVDRKHRIYRASPSTPERRTSFLASESLTFLPPTLGANLPLRKQLLDEIREQLKCDPAQACAVVDHQLKIAYLSEHASRFFQIHSGELSAHVLHMVLPELRLALRAAIAHAEQSGEAVQARRVRLERSGQVLAIHMSVRPVASTRQPHAARGWTIVSFNVAEGVSGLDAGDEADALAGRELLDLHEQLNAAIGESDSSAEALRASNEELQSVNEELRSTSEELETSKEELQSVNEELSTVNLDLKAHLEASAKANDDLHNFIAASEIAIIFVDRAFRIQRFTPRAAGIFNLLATDINRPLFDLTHRLDYAEMEADARQAFESLRPIEREVTSRDGRWFLSRVLPYRSSKDRIEGVVMNFIDVTDRHEAEKSSRDRGEWLSLLFDASADYIIIMLDHDGLITRWNRGAEQALLFTAQEAIGQLDELIFTPEDRVKGVHEAEKLRARDFGRAVDERWHLRKDSSRVYLSGVMVPLMRGSQLGFAKIARDMTHVRMAEKQRDDLLATEQSLRAQLEEASALKDQFLAVVSHELKNPLNLISLNAQMLASLPEAAGSPRLTRIARTIAMGVKTQNQLVDDLLDLSRIQTGKLTLHPEALLFDELVHRIATSVQSDARGRHVELEVQVAQADYAIQADQTRVEQIVWNLANNALKFTGANGNVRMALDGDTDRVFLQVSDTGQGIDPEFLPHVFEMFQQADARATVRGKGGLGIGLALVRQLTEAHGGQVQVASQGVGHGATFSVVLPRRIRRPAADAPTPNSALSNLRILLVDDEEDSLEVLSVILEGEGAVVTIANSASAALDRATEQQFDLIVSDIAMPVMDGYMLIKRLRERGLANVPAVALTGFARPEDRKRALEAGFTAHLGKPFALDAFLGLVPQLFVLPESR